ncbi:hypothetical protein D3C71_1677920 [compost metagenome]
MATLAITPIRKGLSCAVAVAQAATLRASTAAPRVRVENNECKCMKAIQRE